MTNEEINLRIARERGWHSIHTSADGLKGMKGALRGFMLIPDFCSDLNAMHEAEKMLNAGKINTYLGHLYRFNKTAHAGANPWEIIAVRVAVHAPARQRAEAFLRTLGKWEDVQG